MNIDIIELKENDTVLVRHCIGIMSLPDVDKYCDKLMLVLDSIFGKGRVALLPVREGPDWDFTIIRIPRGS